MSPVFTIEHRRDGQHVGRYRVRADGIHAAHQRVRAERVGHERHPDGNARDQLVVTGVAHEKPEAQ